MKWFQSSADIAREIAKPKLSPQIIERFRPPVGEILGISFLMAIQGTAWIGASAIFAHYYFPAWFSVAWLLPTCLLLFWLGVLRGVWLGQFQKPDGAWLMLAEILPLLILFRLVMLVVRPGSEGFADGVMVLDAICATFAWTQGRAGGFNLYRLYLSPYEMPEDEGGAATNAADARHTVDHYYSYRVLHQRWMWSGLLIIALIIAAIFCIADRNNPGRGQDIFNALLLFALIYFGLGLPLLSFWRLRHLRTGWQLNRLTMPRPLASRWIVYAVGLLVAVGLLATFLPHQLDTSWLNFGFTGKRDEEATKQLEQTLQRIFPCSNPQDPRCLVRRTPPPNDSGPLFQLPTEVSLILLSAMVAGIIYGALYLLARSGIALPAFRKFSVKNIWLDFWAWLKSLFALREKPDAVERDKQKGNRAGFFGRFQRERIPHDTRGQIRFHYKHTLERATRAGHPRPNGTTPQEYAAYLAPQMEAPELEPDLHDLTNLYNEARFSSHPISPAQVEQAATETKRLTQHLRLLKRNK